MDDVIKAYLDQHFLSIEQRFQEMGQRFQEVGQRFQEMGKQNQQLREEMIQQNQQLRQELRQEIQEVRQDLGQRLDKVETDVRGAYILIEDLPDKFQIVAEGVANCNEQIKRLDDKMTRELAEIKSFNRQSYQDLDVRVRKLEAAGKT